MGLYIKDMEMPKDGEKLYMITFSDGKACASYKPFEWHEVVPVSPHGRLIDADALKKEHLSGDLDLFAQRWSFLKDVNHAPTIIPASEEGE